MVILLKRYSWGLHFVTIALCSFLLAQAVSSFIAGKLETIAIPLAKESPAEEPVVEPAEEAAGAEVYTAILDRNIFNSQQSASVAVTEEGGISPEQVGELGPAVKTTLDVKLLGALVVDSGTDRRSSATVSGGTSKGAEVYYVGDERSFGTNVRLVKVMKNRIEFLNGSRLEYAELQDIIAKKTIFASAEEVHGLGKEKEGGAAAAPSEGPASVGSEGDKIVVEQQAIDDALANLDKFYTEVRIVPNFKEGKVSGMKVLSVKPGSIVGKLGIRRGDVLEKINGQELDVKRGMTLFSELKDQKNFTIDLVRGGQNKTLEYEIR